MDLNYILLGIIGLLFCAYCLNFNSREGQENWNEKFGTSTKELDKKTKFTLDTDVMRKFGDGCCRFRGSVDGMKDRGYRTIPDCLNVCVNDPNCWAVDYKNPRGDKYSCTTYTGEEEPSDLHVECDKRTQCFKKVITGSAVCTVPQKCPLPPKEQKKLSAVVDSEEFEDKNEKELEILDQIQKGLKEIVGLAVPPSACEDDPLACRPGALTEDQFAEWLKAEAELTKETCEEPEPSSKCDVKKTSDDSPEKKFTEKEISDVLHARCEKQISIEKKDPPNYPSKDLQSYPSKDPPKNSQIEHKHPGLGPPSQPQAQQQAQPQAQPQAQQQVQQQAQQQAQPQAQQQAQPQVQQQAQPQASSASDGNWVLVPKNNNKPLNGKNMHRELSSPAFSKNYVSLFDKI